MTAEGLSRPIVITEPDSLKWLADRLRGERLLAVDTESNSLYAYFERVCLVQFSTRQADYLVDPLALEDLSPLGELIQDPKIEKVFHAAEYDLLCLRRDYGFECNNLFDTMVAARILGYEAVGLGSLLESEFGVYVDKRHQRADWGQRPLPEHLLDYARLDTHYLIDLRKKLKEELKRRELWPLAVEDFRRMATLRAIEENGWAPVEDREVDPWRVKGAYDLEPQQAAVLRELCRYRDKVARAIDRPLFKVINDKTLIHIAVETPTDLESLGRLPGMSPAQVKRHGSQLLQAVVRGLRAEPVYPRRSRRPDEAFLRRQEALREWRKATGLRLGVPSDVVLPRDLMRDLAERDPRDAAELGVVMADVPWRLERFGGEILGVMRKA